MDQLLHDSSFWVGVAFVITVGLLARKLLPVVGRALDARAETIRTQIDEATKLREEAQDLLANHQRKQRDAARDAEAILGHAAEEAQRIQSAAAKDLENALARRRQQALEKIAKAEADAVAAVKTAAVTIAIQAAEKLIREKMKGDSAEALIDRAIEDLPARLH
ncbi:MAG: F0F1 ATP synthase subunit B [Alphaproteobacteria bacterium]